MNTTTPEGYTVDGNGAWVVDGAVQRQGAVGTAEAQNEGNTQNTKAQSSSVDFSAIGKSYADIIRKKTKQETSRYKFALAYIDGDDVPELVVAYLYRISGIDLYGYGDGTVYSIIDDGGVSNIYYIPRKNYIKEIIGMGVGQAEDYVYEQISGRKIQVLKSFSDVHTNWGTVRQEIDGKQVSAQEYAASFAAYDNANGNNYISLLDGFDVTTENLSRLESDPGSFVLG